MQSLATKDFRVAIVGGGVSGLVCAIALQRAGVSVDIFEAAAAFNEIGAGLGLGPNAVRVLKAVGLLDELFKKINTAELRTRGFVYYYGVGEHERILAYEALPEDKGVGIHRAAYLDALMAVVDSQSAHFNKRCISIVPSPTSPNRLLINFSDGTSHETDVVVGADGVKSTVRDYLLDRGDKRVAFSNTVAYRGLIPYKDLQAAGFKTPVTQDPACFVGPSKVFVLLKHIIIFPIKNGEIINVVAFSARYDIPIGSEELPKGTQWVEEVSREVVEKEYEGWGPDVAVLMKCMPEKPNKWSIHVVHPPLDSYVKGRVALIGDAAHAMLPHLGAGAGQGVEDAYMLARLLSHPETRAGNLTAVLDTYSRVRRPRAQMVWDGSRTAGASYDMQGAGSATLEGFRNELRTGFNPVWHHDIDVDVQRAIDMLRASQAFAIQSE
ncbi:FAD/NAD(P)-binding domain-containing protein [Ganoderma leucocontextum]|nr:FAD/NAD(P)-binding domain-containing protein [Ganoderma leucocontextum]